MAHLHEATADTPATGREQQVDRLLQFAHDLAHLATRGVTVSVHGLPFAVFNHETFPEIEVRTHADDDAYLAGTRRDGLFTINGYSVGFASTERGRDLLAATVGLVDGEGRLA